ncbi:PIN domain-containing protein [Aquimarina sp. AU119]|uniref:PIN domain-containing protein n=1 Tax=Aquimarina sp. AU119 TaxID=2108528 RepID=UPI000D69C408|nr:PIN domain-containing protein [Aquimarina sp. AU119]
MLKTFCDTSFLLDFILFPLDRIFNQEISDSNKTKNDFEPILKKYWASKNRIHKLDNIIRKIYDHETQTALVYSPLITLECIEKLVEFNFKDLAIKYGSLERIQKSGKKEIGKVLKKISDDLDKVQGTKKSSHLSDIEFLAYNIFETGYGNADIGLSLYEIYPRDIENMSLKHESNEFEIMVKLSNYQIGAADIMHLKMAKHLGCKNFLTFDTDFIRAKEEIKEMFDLNILYEIKEIEKSI